MDELKRGGFVGAAEIQRDVLKEVMRRSELRQRLEAERGAPISDAEFPQIAERFTHHTTSHIGAKPGKQNCIQGIFE